MKISKIEKMYRFNAESMCLTANKQQIQMEKTGKYFIVCFNIVLFFLMGVSLTSCKLKRVGNEIPAANTTMTIKDDSILMLESIDSDGFIIFEVYLHEISKSSLRKKEIFFPNGNPFKIEYYNEDGQLKGQSREFYQNGCIGYEESYFNGIKNGRCSYYYPDCKKYWSVNFENGLSHGMDTTWWPNGNTKEIYEFDKDIPIDTGFVYSFEGLDSIYFLFENGRKVDSLVFMK